MTTKPKLAEIVIRTTLQPGDIGYVTYLHGAMYNKEYDYGIEFETYVAKGLVEFYNQYDPSKNRAWVCEHEGKIIGFMVLMQRDKAAQLRYFIILPEYRGIGLGNKLMNLFMEFFHECGYRSGYLWTTDELHTAAHLYTKHGFKLAEQVESKAFGKPLKENKYELAL